MENEVSRANILVINPDGSGEEIYASGLRNPVGMDWAPGTETLWTAVNERDELGASPSVRLKISSPDSSLIPKAIRYTEDLLE